MVLIGALLRWCVRFGASGIVADIIVVGITLVKLGGTDYIVKVSFLLFLVSMAPATVFIVYGAKDLEPARFVDVDIREEVGGVDAATLVTWTNWLFTGFISLGSLAGEAADPAKTYPTLVAALIPMTTICEELDIVQTSQSIRNPHL